MEILAIVFLAIVAFVGLAPKAVTQVVLAATWASMLLMAAGSTLYAIFRVIA